MKINPKTTFVLNNSLAAVSVSVTENTLIATDGLNPSLYFFDGDGNFQKTENTLRAYRKLRFNEECKFYTAIGNCETARVYFLDSNLNEFCFTELESENRCDCRNNGSDTLVDVSVTKIGNENFIVGVFSKSAFLFDMSGKRLHKLCETERNETLTDFIAFEQDNYAMSTLKDKTRTVSVSDNGVVKNAILNGNYSLRMLIPGSGGELFALFGNNYIYNKVFKIYSQNLLTLPESSRCI